MSKPNVRIDPYVAHMGGVPTMTWAVYVNGKKDSMWTKKRWANARRRELLFRARLSR